MSTVAGRTSPAPAREAWGLVLELFFSHHRPRVWGVAAEFDLAPMQMLALKNLEPGSELPTSSLAQLLHCDASNVTGIVDRLESRGLIERRPSRRGPAREDARPDRRGRAHA